MATGNSNFAKVATATLQNFSNEIFDSVSTNNALYWLLKQKENIKVVSGGRSFTHPIRYKLNNSFKSYGHLETIVTDLQDNITRAEFPIKTLAGSLVLSKFEVAQNAGDKEKLISLIEDVKEDAKISMSELMGDQLFKDGSAAKDFDGLQHLISITPSTQSDVGGIDSSANTYWQNYVNTTGTAAFNTSQAGLSLMNTALNTCSFGQQGPRAIITTKAVYALYELGLTSNLRYSKTDLADSGFQHLAYTTLPIMFDDNCPAGYMYFIDTDNLWLQVLSQGNMATTRFEASHNQLSDIALMSLYGNMTCGSRRTSGVLTAITA